MVSRVRKSIVCSAAALATAVLSAGCAAGGASGLQSTSPGSARPPASAAGSEASGIGTARCDRTGWQSAPVTVTHVISVPPVPVLTAVRTAQHSECGYDRLVLDISGAIPSYTVRYVSQVTTGASGVQIALPGQRFALITLHEAQAHSAAGVATISRTVRLPGYPALRSWVLAGDDEGVVTIAVGLPSLASVRTGELPGHLYIDFRE